MASLPTSASMPPEMWLGVREALRHQSRRQWSAVPDGVPLPASEAEKSFASTCRTFKGLSYTTEPSSTPTVCLPNSSPTGIITIPEDTEILLIPECRANDRLTTQQQASERQRALRQLAKGAASNDGLRSQLDNLRYVAFTSDTGGDWALSALHDHDSRASLLALDETLDHRLQFHWLCPGCSTVPDEPPANLVIHSDCNHVPSFQHTAWPDADSSLRWEVTTPEATSPIFSELSRFGRGIGLAGSDWRREIIISTTGHQKDKALVSALLEAAPTISRRLTEDGYVFKVLVDEKEVFPSGGE